MSYNPSISHDVYLQSIIDYLLTIGVYDEVESFTIESDAILKVQLMDHSEWDGRYDMSIRLDDLIMEC